MKLFVIYNYKTKHPELKGKALTDALIRDCLGCSDVKIRRTDRGKPYVQWSGNDGRSDRYISVSHSEGTFALLVSDRNVGLDIQYSRDIDTDRIASRCFAAEEAEFSQEDGTGNGFFELWTRKEAWSKYTGEGLEHVMKKQQVLKREDVALIDLRLADGCYCAVCTEKEGGCKADEIQISYRE